ncbi:MAG: pullulanase-type alpha-1,6-glucosidase [Oligoflexus sp.]
MDRFFVHFRSLDDSRNWRPDLIHGQAIISPMQLTDFGLQMEVITADRSELSLRFISQDKRASFAYQIPDSTENIYLFESSPNIFTSAPPVLPQENEIVIYYQDPEQNYQNWGLHIWDESGLDWTSWDRPLALDLSQNYAEFGAYVKLPLPRSAVYSATPPAYRNFPEKIGLVLHRGAEKSSTENQYIFPEQAGQLFFLKKGQSEVYCTPDLLPCPKKTTVIGAGAHWIASGDLRWDVPLNPDWQYQLIFSPNAEILNQGKLKQNGDQQSVHLEPSMFAQTDSKFPHLKNFKSFKLHMIPENFDQALRSQIYAVALDRKSGELIHITRVQTPGVIDELYRFDGSLGLIVEEEKSELRLWAPTAKKVHLQIYGHDFALQAAVPMQRDTKGVWRFSLPERWVNERLYYRYQIEVYHYLTDRIESYEVTDPYSTSLSANSVFSQLVNLNDNDLKPDGWKDMHKPKLAHPADISILELHIRDFSSYDHSVPQQLRGGYSAFATASQYNLENLTLGQEYLKSLQEAGLTHVQILPANDFATIREKRQERIELDDPFSRLCLIGNAPQALCDEFGDETIDSVLQRLPKDTGLIQEIESYLRSHDGFNWGYDPLHFGVPEGSYASEPDGITRIVEFRQMVQALSKLGLLLSMDVVFNHTFASGTYPESILDRIVPGYYHRRHPQSGRVETTTCCPNTASEHSMMEKLMVDTLLRWREHYRIDAFRFDLMGHHMKSNMLSIKEKLGSDVYLYGEGWDFGEVAQGQRGVNATQTNLSGSGIATFNDRFRDAIRGGGPFDCGVELAKQGYGNGLYVEPNDYHGLPEPSVAFADCTQASQYQAASHDKVEAKFKSVLDHIQVGLVGSLKKFSFHDSHGQIRFAGEIPYGDSVVGYTSEPYETINYISKHDNQTLWDINQLKLPRNHSLEERRQTQEFAVSLTILAQGIPFFQLGVDLLRSKSLSRDSYNSGDWFNRVDYTGKLHNWNIGLPRQDKDGANWKYFREILHDLPNPATKELIDLMRQRFRMWLSIRYSTPLFRLRDAKSVQDRLKFLQVSPGQPELSGIIAMKIGDEPCHFDQELDERWNDVVTVFNPRPTPVIVKAPGYHLHELLTPLITGDGDDYWLAGRSTGVWLRPQNGSCFSDQPVRVLVPNDG